MNSRNLLNLILAIVVIGLGIAIWFSQQKAPAPEPERITNLGEAEITRIEIHPARHADARLERRGTEWWLVAPFTARADMARVDAAIGLARAVSQARYAATAVDERQAGLDAPDLVLRINEVELRLGGTEPLHGRRFVRVGDRVHLIVDRYSYLLQGGVASLVSPQLLPTGARLLELELPGLHLLRRDGRWQRADGGAASADALQALVDEWLQVRALRVSRSDEASPVGEAVTLQLAGDFPPLRLVLQRDEDEARLIRPDLGLVYHFTPAVAERLLALPPAGDDDA